MGEVPHRGESVEVKQIVSMPVSDVDFGTITITENWGRLFIRHRDGAEVVVERNAYARLVEAIERFITDESK